MKKTTCTILSAIACCALWAQSVSTSGFSPDTVRPGGTATYKLVFKDVSGRADISQMRLPDGLKIVGQNRSQNYSFTNGKMSNSTSISLTMLAEKEGVLKIPQWEIKVGGKSFKIGEAALKVDPNAPAAADPDDSAFADPFADPFSMLRRNTQQAAAQRRQQTQSFESSLKNNVKLEIKIPRKSLYVGEAVPCQLVFSADPKLAEHGFSLAQIVPETKKADAFDVAPIPEKPSIDSSGIVKYTTSITPLKVGSHTLDFAVHCLFNRQMNSDDIFSMFGSMSSFFGNRPVQIEVSASEKIEVLPLPDEGKPANFTGAIGNFSLEKPVVEPDALNVGDPCTITVKIIGTGNFPRIHEPKLDAGADWKIYKAKTSFIDESNGLSNIGIKTFEYTAVPKKPDLPHAPAVLFNYFNPDSKKYVEIKSEPVEVSVAPVGRAKPAKESAAKDAGPALDSISEKPDAAESGNILSSPAFWGAQILILASVCGFIAIRRESLKRANDPAYAKRLACRRGAARHLKNARHAKSDPAKFFGEAKNAVRHALAAGSESEPLSITKGEARAQLEEAGFSEDDISAAEEFFGGADAIAYGAASAEDFDAEKSAKKLAALVEKILSCKR